MAASSSASEKAANSDEGHAAGEVHFPANLTPVFRKPRNVVAEADAAGLTPVAHFR